MNKLLRIALAIVGTALLASCSQATSSSSDSSSNGSPLSGKIAGTGFTPTTIIASASTTKGSYDIAMASGTSYPLLALTVSSDPKTYTVTTFGANGGLFVYALKDSAGNSIAFDSGSVTISSVDTAAKAITGSFSSVNTTDGKSSMAGTFTAKIQ